MRNFKSRLAFVIFATAPIPFIIAAPIPSAPSPANASNPVQVLSDGLVAGTRRLVTRTDILNLVDVKRIPVSVLSSGNTSADNIQISQVREGPGSIAGDGDGHHDEEDALLEALLHAVSPEDDPRDNGARGTGLEAQDSASDNAPKSADGSGGSALDRRDEPGQTDDNGGKLPEDLTFGIPRLAGNANRLSHVPRFDLLNLINPKYVPVSALSSGNTSADKIQITQGAPAVGETD